jgi:hypothetical protein
MPLSFFAAPVHTKLLLYREMQGDDIKNKATTVMFQIRISGGDCSSLSKL